MPERCLAQLSDGPLTCTLEYGHEGGHVYRASNFYPHEEDLESA